MSQTQKSTPSTKQSSGRNMLPFLIDFVKFAAGFVALIAIGLFSLHIANAAL